MMTGQMKTTTRQFEQVTSTAHQSNRQRQHLILEDSEDELDQITSSLIDHVVTAVNNLPQFLQRCATQNRLLNTWVPNFSGSKDNFHKIERLQFNHLWLHEHCITKEHRLHYFQSLLRDKTVDLWQMLRISPETTLKDVLYNYREEFAGNNLEEIPNWNRIS